MKDKIPAEPKQPQHSTGPIFISARFRSGSTLLWNMFNSLPGFTAYYEPFHDSLTTHIGKTKPMKSHRGVVSYWDSYKSFTGELKQHHRREFGFSRLILEKEEDHDELKAYLYFLLDQARPNRAVFQFNRVDFRLPWLRRHFPDATIVHLVRNPRDTWISSRRHLPGKKWEDPYEPDAYDLLQWTASLEEKLPFLTHPEPASSYEPHYYIWKLSELMGRRWSDCRLDYDADILETPSRGLEKLVRAGCLTAEEADQSGQLIMSDVHSNWRRYDNEDYYIEIENRCERTLENLGLISDFGKKSLDRIRKNHKSKWRAYQKGGPSGIVSALLSACSKQRSEITRLLEDVNSGNPLQKGGENRTTDEEGCFILNENSVGAWKKLPLSDQLTQNGKILDKFVVTWDTLCRCPFGTHGPKNHKVIFLHIPKASGTTLDSIIPRNYKMEGMVHINAPLIYEYPGELVKSGKIPAVVMGHYKLNDVVYQGVDKYLAHITILREPIDRIISHYNFVRTSPTHSGYQRAMEDGFERYVTSEENMECFNAQVLRLTGHLNRQILKSPEKVEKLLPTAKQNLERRFSLFGITERFDEFLLICRHLLGWKDIFYTRQRVAADHPDKIHRRDLTESIMEKLREQNKYDLDFYAYAENLFKKRLDQLNISEDSLQEFSHRNDEFKSFLSSPLGSVP